MLPIVVPDLHGRFDLLSVLLRHFSSRSFVFLGDLTDRGPHSQQVVRAVRRLVYDDQAVALCGNHDAALQESVLDEAPRVNWYRNGGLVTVESYTTAAALIEDAMWMRANMRPWYQEGKYLFSHAMRPSRQDPLAHVLGRPISDGPVKRTPVYPLPEGVTVSVHGHTVLPGAPLRWTQPDGTSLMFLDAGAVHFGVLACYDCESEEVFLVIRREWEERPVIQLGTLAEVASLENVRGR